MTKSDENFLKATNKYLNQLLDEKDKEIEDLYTKIRDLKGELKQLRKEYYGEVHANTQLINANTRLMDDNKWLIRDVQRISKALKYIDSCKKEIGFVCNVKTLKGILQGIDKEDLEE